MPQSSSNPRQAKPARLAQARRILSTHSSNPPRRLARNATVDQAFVDAALNYRRCTKDYMKASATWAEFAARYGYDDPAHAEHHTKLTQTRRALQGADEALSVAEEALLGVRS